MRAKTAQGEFVFEHGWANAAHRAPGEDRGALSRALFGPIGGPTGHRRRGGSAAVARSPI